MVINFQCARSYSLLMGYIQFKLLKIHGVRIFEILKFSPKTADFVHVLMRICCLLLPRSYLSDLLAATLRDDVHSLTLFVPRILFICQIITNPCSVKSYLFIDNTTRWSTNTIFGSRRMECTAVMLVSFFERKLSFAKGVFLVVSSGSSCSFVDGLGV